MASKNVIDTGGNMPGPRCDNSLNKVKVETIIPRAANTRMKSVTHVKREATWLKYVEERRNLKSKTNMGGGQMVNKEPILLKKAPIKTTSMPCISCPAIKRNRSKWIWNFVDKKPRWKSTCVLRR